MVLRLLYPTHMRIASVSALLLTIVACKDSSPAAPLPPSAALDPGWYGGAHVPQLGDVSATYDRIGEQTVAALSAGLLICHVDVPSDPHDNSPPDLLLWLTIGKRHAVWVRAPFSNSWSATVSWPAVDLVMGEQITISLYDEDSWSNDDFIARFETKFDGRLPILMGDATAAVECRALEPKVLQARLGDALVDADRSLAALDAIAAPDFAASHLERPSEAVDGARRAITNAAALVGWHTPAVKSRVEREQAAERTWKQQVADAAERLATTLPAPGTGAIHATMTCDAVAIDRALPVDQRPYRPQSACFVTITGLPVDSFGLELYSPRGTLTPASCCRATNQFLFPVSAVDVAEARFVRLTRRGEAPLILRVR